MTYEFYKVLHLVGLFLVISGLMGVFFTVWSGQQLNGKIKSSSFALHGLGLVLILVSGFGLLAKLGLAREMPNWAYVKMGIWVIFALAISLFKRKAQLGMPLYILLLGCYAAAAYLGVYKPMI